MKGGESKRPRSTKRAGTASKSKATTRTFTAFHKVYEPFRLGGPWIKKTFEVEAEPVKLGKDVDGFVFFDEKHSKQWKVYEAKSGGCIAGHADRDEAIAKAIYDIKRTPDFQDQIEAICKEVGEAGDMDEVLAIVAIVTKRKARGEE